MRSLVKRRTVTLDRCTDGRLGPASRRRMRAGIVAATLTAGTVVYRAAVQPWQRHWGATAVEIVQPMPGDAEIFARGGSIIATQAITVAAEPNEVWPWLVQMGVGRGGFYTLTCVENALGLGVTNAEALGPTWQRLAVGDVVGIRSATEGARVINLHPGRSLVLLDEPSQGFVSIWDFGLYPTAGGSTRLVLRRGGTVPSVVERIINAVLEPGYFMMDRGMLLGIKHRVEAQTKEARVGG